MVIFYSYTSLPEGIYIWVCLKMSCTPINPMVLLIMKSRFFNGYVIGNIAYFQTNPYVKYCKYCT